MIYLDNAATTSVRKEVVEAMMPYFSDKFGNPSGIYRFATQSKNAISEVRKTIARSLGGKPDEIYFTAGGSESDNWALKATMEAYWEKGNHIITSKIEHHAILNTCAYLETLGYEVSYIDVDEQGVIKLSELKKAIRPTTVLISVMFANNEVGTIQPIKEIGAIAEEYDILFHTDAVQAYGHIPIDVVEYKIDLLSASGHKLNGPKGIGFLYIRDGVKTGSFVHGGSQERKKRAGTEHVSGIIGLGKAVELAFDDIENQMKKETKLRECLIQGILSKVPYARLNGHRTCRLPSNVNFSFQFIEGEELLILMDMYGICASGGSACSTGSKSPSHVLLAMGLPEEIAYGTLRLSLGHETTEEEIQTTIQTIVDLVSELRDKSYCDLNW